MVQPRVVGMAVVAAVLVAGGASLAQRRVVVTQTQRVSGVEAMRLLASRGEDDRVIEFGNRLLWQNIRQPEALSLMSQALRRKGQHEQAAAYAALFLRIVDEEQDPRMARQKPMAERFLEEVDRQTDAPQQPEEPGAFPGPEGVDDRWMRWVEADLHSLHGLYAWKLVGGRQGAREDWIHNREGELHRSGMKYVPSLEGRQGVLFTVPGRIKPRDQKGAESPEIAERQPTVIRFTHPPQGRYLRIGTRGYGFPYLLEVRRGDGKLLSEKISDKRWSDLKVDLGEGSASEDPVTIHLIVPEDQRWFEGAWIDYLDSFTD